MMARAQWQKCVVTDIPDATTTCGSVSLHFHAIMAQGQPCKLKKNANINQRDKPPPTNGPPCRPTNHPEPTQETEAQETSPREDTRTSQANPRTTPSKPYPQAPTQAEEALRRQSSHANPSPQFAFGSKLKPRFGVSRTKSCGYDKHFFKM